MHYPQVNMKCLAQDGILFGSTFLLFDHFHMSLLVIFLPTLLVKDVPDYNIESLIHRRNLCKFIKLICINIYYNQQFNTD